jgi:uncharacterized membrane protein YphA (DoxX/SURF4 family)
MGERTMVAFLVPLRLYTGWVFLLASLSKIAGGWLDQPHLRTLVGEWMRKGEPYRLIVPILRGLVLPHAIFFSWIVASCELITGALLLAGLFTRPAAALGLLLSFNYLLARGEGLAANSTSPFVVILATLLLTQPGRTLGADAALRGRLPDWLV